MVGLSGADGGRFLRRGNETYLSLSESIRVWMPLLYGDCPAIARLRLLGKQTIGLEMLSTLSRHLYTLSSWRFQIESFNFWQLLKGKLSNCSKCTFGKSQLLEWTAREGRSGWLEQLPEWRESATILIGWVSRQWQMPRVSAWTGSWRLRITM